MRRAGELLVLAILALRHWLEGQAERRHPLLTLTCDRWSVSVRAGRDSVARRFVDAWNEDPERRAVAEARLEGDDTFVLTTEEGSLISARIETLGVNASWPDIAASLAARAALFLLPGGSRT